MFIIGSHQKLYQEWKSLHGTMQKFQASLSRNAMPFGFSFFEVCGLLNLVPVHNRYKYKKKKKNNWKGGVFIHWTTGLTFDPNNGTNQCSI